LIQLDIWANDRQQIKLAGPNPECRTCGKHDFEFLEAENQEFSAVLCGRNAVQISPTNAAPLDLKRLAVQLAPLGEIRQNEYLVRFKAGDNEITIFKDARAIISGTDDVTKARSLYARFVGV
jgi:adenylyltransferase/sulfurtransferase